MRTDKALGYREPALPATVFALADPDAAPLPQPTRATLVWQDDAWVEIDGKTGAILGRGTAAEAANKERQRT